MVGTTAQMISLVSYGNEYLITGIADKEFKHHTAFKFCRFVTFKVRTAEKIEFGTNELILGDACEWFDYLKKDGCVKLRLLYKNIDKNKKIPDYMSAGFTDGGGQWYIEAVFENKSIFWASKWILNKFGAQDNRIWEVTYTNVHTDGKTVNIQYDLDKIKAEFLEVLIDIKKFAAQTNRNPWIDRFRSAIDVLKSNEPTSEFHMDLIIEKNYTLAARQLIAGAQKAWVFGGMGWWNDYYYEDKLEQEENVRLSKSLYSLICKTITAAINSF